MKKIATLILMMFCALPMNAQEVDDKEISLKIIIKDNKGVIFYFDGKQYDSDTAELFDSEKIDSVTLLKGEEAMKK